MACDRGIHGTNFIYRMMADHPDLEIVCFDALTYAGNVHNLDRAMMERRFKFIKGDISKKETVFAALKGQGIDAVVNFAAESHVDRSIEDPGIFLVSNVIGTQVLMDGCRKFDIERYHQISTDEVYGDLPLDSRTCSMRIRPSTVAHIRPASLPICWSKPSIGCMA
jgi:dTDP-glucose 4,6-dehydratase